MNRRNFLINTIVSSIGISLLPITGFSQTKSYDYISVPNPAVMVSFRDNTNKYVEKSFFVFTHKVSSLEEFMETNKDNVIFLYKYDQETFAGTTFKYVRAFTIPKGYVGDVSSIRINTNPVTWKTLK
jgi:hypothetical protein